MIIMDPVEWIEIALVRTGTVVVVSTNEPFQVIV
jgi:hypothetical protein